MYIEKLGEIFMILNYIFYVNRMFCVKDNTRAVLFILRESLFVVT